VAPNIITLSTKDGVLHAVEQRRPLSDVLSSYKGTPGVYTVRDKLPGGTWCASYVGETNNLQQRMKGYMHWTQDGQGEHYFAPDKCCASKDFIASAKFMLSLELLCKGAEVQIL
jgi:hypothetical protein